MTIDSFRLEYPLNSQSIVIDAGGYIGEFSLACQAKWGCYICAFEPCFEFRRHGNWERFTGLLKPYGLGAVSGVRHLTIAGDGTSFHRGSNTSGKYVAVEDIAEVFTRLNLHQIDLLKLNVEGGEYEIIDRLAESGWMPRIRFIQVQFHQWGMPAGQHGERRAQSRAVLEKSHREQWNVGDFVWESWERGSQ